MKAQAWAVGNSIRADSFALSPRSQKGNRDKTYVVAVIRYRPGHPPVK